MARAAKKSNQKRQRAHSSLLTKLLILILLVAAGWQLHALQGQVAAAEVERERLAQVVEAKKQENEALAADIAEGNTPEKVEEIARRELGWVTQGEYVFYPRNN